MSWATSSAIGWPRRAVGTSCAQNIPRRTKNATSARNVRAMIVTVRNTSPIGIRGMARSAFCVAPIVKFPSPGKGFRMTGSRCMLSPGRVLAEALDELP